VTADSVLVLSFFVLITLPLIEEFCLEALLIPVITAATIRLSRSDSVLLSSAGLTSTDLTRLRLLDLIFSILF